MADLTEHWRYMAKYNAWQNGQLMDKASALTDAERKEDRGAFFGSVHATFDHIILADIAWLKRFYDWLGHATLADVDFPVPLTGLRTELYADFEALCAARRDLDNVIQSWTQTDLPDAKVAEVITFKSMQGLQSQLAIWVGISHMFNHATHHRAQIGTLLMQAGIDPGVTDMPFLPAGQSA